MNCQVAKIQPPQGPPKADLAEFTQEKPEMCAPMSGREIGPSESASNGCSLPN